MGGGNGNQATTNYATVGGGYYNHANGYAATVSGGYVNWATNQNATVAGGSRNLAGGDSATVGGGTNNIAIADYSTVSGGSHNTASGQYAMVPGGRLNAATGDYSYAAGRRAKANHPGAYVWADSQDADFASTANNQYLVRASGGVGINTPNPGATLDVNGTLRVGAGTTVFKNIQGGIAQMASGSDTVKTNFTFTFPQAFSTVPKVIISTTSDNVVPVDDTFAVTVRAVTTTSCTVNIVRVDNPSGWGQRVKINWLAWE